MPVTIEVQERAVKSKIKSLDGLVKFFGIIRDEAGAELYRSQYRESATTARRDAVRYADKHGMTYVDR